MISPENVSYITTLTTASSPTKISEAEIFSSGVVFANTLNVWVAFAERTKVDSFNCANTGYSPDFKSDRVMFLVVLPSSVWYVVVLFRTVIVKSSPNVAPSIVTVILTSSPS